MAERVCVARLLGAHGVKGLVKVQPLTEDPDTLEALDGLEDEAGRKVKLEIEGVSKDAFLARLTGIATREEAQARKGEGLYVARDALPEPDDGEFYFADLIGLKVEEGDDILGHVVAVMDFGAGPLLEVKPAGGGGTVFVPFTQDVVPEVDLAGKRLVVSLPEGLWPGR